jgi:4,5-dihydroxyphthalate decarboxylase
VPERKAETIVGANGTASVHLTLAVCDYEHVREITQGLVRADGITLTPLIFPSIEEITFRFTRSLEWDVSELSFGKYISLTSQGLAPMVAIPVFPSRVHRHSAIYVRADRGIKTAQELEGRAVGIPEWAQTAGIYVRGILAEEYGVDLTKIRWLQAGVSEPGRAEKVELKLPGGIHYQSRPDTSLSAMLASGEIDAVISARAPDAFTPGGAVVRLLPNYRAEEERFFKKTGIFPIMHLITIRRTALEQYPWIAMNLFKMFDEAKRRCFSRMRDFTCARIPLPWAAAITEEVAEAFGPDPYPYGIAESRPTLEAFCRYAHDQGVTHRRMAVEDLFPREVQGAARV